jgi:hypothetical protein
VDRVLCRAVVRWRAGSQFFKVGSIESNEKKKDWFWCTDEDFSWFTKEWKDLEYEFLKD